MEIKTKIIDGKEVTFKKVKVVDDHTTVFKCGGGPGCNESK